MSINEPWPKSTLIITAVVKIVHCRPDIILWERGREEGGGQRRQGREGGGGGRVGRVGAGGGQGGGGWRCMFHFLSLGVGAYRWSYGGIARVSLPFARQRYSRLAVSFLEKTAHKTRLFDDHLLI